jgi:hypothetical protein
MKIYISKLLTMSFLFLLVVMTVGCKKTPDCELFNTGEITITNSKPHTYECYVNTTYLGDVSAGSSRTFEVSAGTKQISVEQKNGWTFFPNVYSGTRTVQACQTSTFGF